MDVLILALALTQIPDPLQVELDRFGVGYGDCGKAIADAGEQIRLWERHRVTRQGADRDEALHYIKQMHRAVDCWAILQQACWEDVPPRGNYHTRYGLLKLQKLREAIGDDCYERGIIWYPVCERLRLKTR